ncbi:hypothetical protein L3049_17135 [Labilibaculum sp. DW002]|uniref:Cupin 2 conserved barrel domain-containing protein n=1 Tax=Paralabilibaculum antarcticum TaxID=2912572 RepID=A0ABT5VWE3_9BACT|nr:hypothetical protein [Labilibaculum sp. DW002]MDE5419720.1 hypothetical protein [Labilibaculum sp. DW002]
MLQKAISDKISVSAIQKEQIYSNNSFESLIVSVEKGMIVPEQPAPANAVLYVIFGKMQFEIDGRTSIVESDDLFTFSKGQMHGLKAILDSKFLISRTIE